MKKLVFTLGFMLVVLSASATISWMGNHSTGTQPNNSQTIHFYVEMFDSYAGCHAEIQMNEGGIWVAYSMTQGANNGNNSTWTADVNVKSNSTAYYFHGWDDWNANVYDSNGGSNYSISINPTTKSGGDALWNSAGNWCDGSVPASTSATYIIAHDLTLNNDVSVGSIIINSGIVFTASDETPRTLTVVKSIAGTSATLTNNGTWSNGSGGSTIVFTGAPGSGDAIHATSGAMAFQNITINKTGGISNVGASFGTNSSVSATLEIGAGGFISTAPPTDFYGSTAILKFNQGVGISYDVNESDYSWSSSQVPNYITINSGIVNLNANRTASGNLSLASGSVLNVSAGRQLTTTGSLTNNGSLNLLSTTGAGTATILTPASITGSETVNVQQFLTGFAGTSTRANWYLSSPVSAATAAVFNVEGGTNKMTSYNETVPGYVAQFTSNTTALVPGKGYVTYIGGTDATYTFTGTLNNGDLAPVTVTRTGATAGKRGFNLVGNPYPSYLDWNAVKAAATNSSNVRPTIWYRTLLSGSIDGTMTFDTFDGTTGTNNGANGLVTQYVPPMQAFWMKVDADDTSVTLNFVNGQRSHKDQSLTTNRLRAPGVDELQILRLKVSNGINSDAAIIVSDPNALDVFDYYDSQKMTNDNVNVPEIYTLAGAEELVINHVNNFSANKELALGFRPGMINNFTIEATEISNLNSDLKVMLLDKLTNTEQELTPGSPYSFTSDATASNDRFSILFKSASITTGPGNAADNSDVLVYRNLNNQITVICNGGINEQSSVSVYNAVGQKLTHQKLTHQKLTKTTTEINGTFTPGVYMVTVNNGGQNMTKKIIIK